MNHSLIDQVPFRLTLSLLTSAAACSAGLAGQSVHQAAREGSVEKVRAYLEKNASDVHFRDGDRRIPLHLAARYGRLKVVELLVESGSDLDAQAYNKFTPLMLAATFNRLPVVEHLVTKGAALELKSAFGATALEIAAEHGALPVVERLRKAGAILTLRCAALLGDVPATRAALLRDPKAAKQWRVLWDACRKGHHEIVKLLLRSGAPHESVGMMSPSVSMMVPGLAHPKVLAALVEGGVDVDPTLQSYKGASNGATPLLMAAGRGLAGSVDVLLAKGADWRHRDVRDWNALHYAASRGHLGLVQRIIKLGVDPLAKTRGGRTAMLLAARSIALEFNQSPPATRARNARLRSVVAELAKAGAVDLETAVWIGDVKTTRRLLRARREALPQDRRDLDDLLLLAVKQGTELVADLLASHGADVDAEDSSGYRPLHWAAILNRFGAAKVLIDRGAEVSPKRQTGATPLHESCRCGAVRVAGLLVRAGADRDASDGKGNKPADLIRPGPDEAGLRRLLAEK